MTKEEMVIEILNKGEMQISDLERESQNEKLKLEIANWIVRLSINSDNGNAFPVSIITKALTQANCRIKDTKTAKP
jgi:ribosome maturation protein SDO1